MHACDILKCQINVYGKRIPLGTKVKFCPLLRTTHSEVLMAILLPENSVIIFTRIFDNVMNQPSITLCCAIEKYL